MKVGRIALSIVGLLSLSVAQGDGPRTSTEIAKITPSDGGYGGYGFGASIAVSGDDLVVGGYGYFLPSGEVVGIVYVFHRSGPRWIQTAQLFADFGVPEESFGLSVGIDGDIIVVGAPQIIPGVIGGGYGAAYIFTRYDPGTPADPLDDQWQDSRLTSPDELRWGDMFGYSVSTSQGTVLVGRPGDTYSSGSAYLYRRVNNVWVHAASLNPSDPILDDAFGIAVSLSGPVALVGAWNRSDVGFRSGAAYVFKETGGLWAQEAKLIASDAAAFDSFGGSVSIAGDCAVAGAQGSAYVFAQGEVPWSNETKLVASDVGDLDGYGQAVATDGSTIVVGAPGNDGVAISYGGNTGVAYLFQFDDGQWVEERKLVASDPSQNSVLGASVAAQGNYVFAGAQEAVYVYVKPSAAKSLRDFAVFQTCFGRQEPQYGAECAKLDLVHDGRIDSLDFNEFLATFAGP